MTVTNEFFMPPPAGARDALAPLLSEAAALLWGCPDDDVADDCAKRLIRAAKALTGKADGTQPAAPGAGESESDRVRRMVGDPRRGVEVRTMEPNTAATGMGEAAIAAQPVSKAESEVHIQILTEALDELGKSGFSAERAALNAAISALNKQSA